MPNDKEIDTTPAAAVEDTDDDAGEAGGQAAGAEPTIQDRAAAKARAEVSPEERETRRQRREQRAEKFNEQVRQANEAAAAARAEAEQTRREIAEIRGRLTERESANPKADPRDEKIAQLEAEAKGLLRQAGPLMQTNPVEAERLIDEHNRRMREAAVVAADKRYDERRAEEQKNQPQRLPEAIQHDLLRVSAEHTFLRENQAAMVMFGGLIDAMTAGGKMPQNYTTFKAAAAQVAKVLGIGGQSAPSERQRSAYNGMGAGEADGGGGEPEGRHDPQLDKHQRALAQALANRRGTGEAGNEALASWQKTVGRRIKRAE